MTWTQLRIYDIEPGHLDEFVAAWVGGVLPLRRRFGFSIVAWTVVDEARFVWLLTYAGHGSFDDADEAYYASPERAELEPDPAQWVVGQVSLLLQPVDSGAGR